MPCRAVLIHSNLDIPGASDVRERLSFWSPAERLPKRCHHSLRSLHFETAARQRSVEVRNHVPKTIHAQNRPRPLFRSALDSRNPIQNLHLVQHRPNLLGHDFPRRQSCRCRGKHIPSVKSRRGSRQKQLPVRNLPHNDLALFALPNQTQHTVVRRNKVLPECLHQNRLPFCTHARIDHNHVKCFCREVRCCLVNGIRA